MHHSLFLQSHFSIFRRFTALISLLYIPHEILTNFIYYYLFIIQYLIFFYQNNKPNSNSGMLVIFLSIFFFFIFNISFRFHFIHTHTHTYRLCRNVVFDTKRPLRMKYILFAAEARRTDYPWRSFPVRPSVRFWPLSTIFLILLTLVTIPLTRVPWIINVGLSSLLNVLNRFWSYHNY